MVFKLLMVWSMVGCGGLQWYVLFLVYFCGPVWSVCIMCYCVDLF